MKSSSKWRRIAKKATLGAVYLIVVWFAFVGAVSLMERAQPQTPSNPAPSGASVSEDTVVPDIYQLWRLTNDARYNAGVPAVNLSLYLEASATEKCNDMVARDYWSHNAPDGTAPWVFVGKHYPNYVTAGENLAYGGVNTAQSLMDRWMNSEEHKKNILNPKFTDVGFSYCESPDFIHEGKKIIVVEHFAS